MNFFVKQVLLCGFVLGFSLSFSQAGLAATSGCGDNKVDSYRNKLQRANTKMSSAEEKRDELKQRCEQLKKSAKKKCRNRVASYRRKIKKYSRDAKKFGRKITRCGGSVDPTPTPSPNPSVAPTPTSGYLIVDHTAVQQFDNIPDYWLEKAKELAMHYAHTSHGSQIVSGLNYLENHVDSTKYSFARRSSESSAGLPPVESPAAFRMYDGNPPDTYITPERYWSERSGVNSTKAVVDSGDYNFSMWAWCGQQSSNSEVTVNQYLGVMNDFETEYPGMRFIYMTGHTDGGGAALDRNNQMVRDYVIANNKVLFDFADIESWDPDGNNHPRTSDDCAWCSTWCSNNPQDCQNLPSCAHSHGLNCVLKGKAFWWMMAKLAGWE